MRSFPRPARQTVRSLFLRSALAFVLIWFGISQARAPDGWTEFVPAFLSNSAPVSPVDLVRVHAFVLILAAAGVVLGIQFVASCTLATLDLVLVTVALILDGGDAGLIVRDVGLVALAIGLLLDSDRSWRLDALPWSKGWKRSRRLAWHVGTASVTLLSVGGIVAYLCASSYA